jgi:hypothetical protein
MSPLRLESKKVAGCLTQAKMVVLLEVGGRGGPLEAARGNASASFSRLEESPGIPVILRCGSAVP